MGTAIKHPREGSTDDDDHPQAAPDFVFACYLGFDSRRRDCGCPDARADGDAGRHAGSRRGSAAAGPGPAPRRRPPRRSRVPAARPFAVARDAAGRRPRDVARRAAARRGAGAERRVEVRGDGLLPRAAALLVGPARRRPGLDANGDPVPPSAAGTQLRTPPLVPDANYIDWRYTNSFVAPWTELNFKYGNDRVKAHGPDRVVQPDRSRVTAASSRTWASTRRSSRCCGPSSATTRTCT